MIYETIEALFTVIMSFAVTGLRLLGLYLVAWAAIAFFPALIWSELQFDRFTTLWPRIVVRSHEFLWKAFTEICKALGCACSAVWEVVVENRKAILNGFAVIVLVPIMFIVHICWFICFFYWLYLSARMAIAFFYWDVQTLGERAPHYLANTAFIAILPLVYATAAANANREKRLSAEKWRLEQERQRLEELRNPRPKPRVEPRPTPRPVVTSTPSVPAPVRPQPTVPRPPQTITEEAHPEKVEEAMPATRRVVGAITRRGIKPKSDPPQTTTWRGRS